MISQPKNLPGWGDFGRRYEGLRTREKGRESKDERARMKEQGRKTKAEDYG